MNDIACIKGRGDVNNVHILREEICIMKINRRKALVMLAVLWVIGIGVMVAGREEKEADIVAAFASNDYVSTVGQVHAYVNYGSEYLSYSDRQDVVESIAAALGIDSEVKLEIARDKKGDGYVVTSSYTLVSPTASTKISIVSVEREDVDAVMALEQYILVDVAIDNSAESIVYYRDCLEKLFDSMDVDADIMLSLKGSIRGTLGNDEKNQITEKILESLDGELITGSRSKELYTVYGYADSIDEYVVNGTTKSNINIAITYDGSNDVSWVYVATPILQEDY